MPADREAAQTLPAHSFEGWRGAALIAATYVYFLIFAQFGFLKRLDQAGISGGSLKPIMAAMALGGIVASLWSARQTTASAPRRLRFAVAGCAAAAALSLLPLHAIGFAGVAALIGIALGGLTVTLVANLSLWIGAHRPLLGVGIGTGIGYLLCNVPPIFTASPQRIALVAVVACGCALVAASRTVGTRDAPDATPPSQHGPPFALVLAWFTALVWLDSAAFFIIQNSPALKSGTWEGSAHLWRTGLIHLAAALAGAWLLARRGTAWTLLLAFASLGTACLLLLDPSRSAAAAILYPAGVSLYSVALVAYPSFLTHGASQQRRSRTAGWIYATAGWMGSALGIGMAQNLHRIPAGFVAPAAILFFVPWLWRLRRGYLRQVAAIALVLAAAFALAHLEHPNAAQNPIAPGVTAVERGRRVYIAEGCINCHSQYVRPHSPDVQLWGPAESLDAIRREDPPLIGNRRQGPDLSEVGARRSPLWLRIHTIDPRALNPGSIMPSYAYLFGGQRGNDLIAYLASLQSSDSLQHIKAESAAWQPSPAGVADAERLNAGKLFGEYCASCHDPGGAVRTQWASAFQRIPPDLATAPWRDVPPQADPAELRLRLAQIIRFGVPGTDMPGHEYLPDNQIVALARYTAALRKTQ